MFRPLASDRTPNRRRGALLIVVLALLTLFAIVGITFVFYAGAEADSARIAREAEAVGDVDTNDYADAAAKSTLASILFDDFDTTSTGVMNPLRGHSLARSKFGWIGSPAVGDPFNGIGTFHETAPHGIDRAAWINHAVPFTVTPATATPQFPANTYWLDPEWTGYRTTAELGLQPGTIPMRPQAYIPKNAPYTYPDLKDLILASTSPSTGEVLVKSLHRDWLFNSQNPNVNFRLAPWNPSDNAMTPPYGTYRGAELNTDWVSPEGRTRILRPRPVDQLTPGDFASAGLPYPIAPGMTNYTAAQLNGLFNLINSRITLGQIIPYPMFNADGSFTGDVQNKLGGVGIQKNDSMLIDIGMQPRQWNGKWIKPMASILVEDLDGKLDLNVHGNMRGGASTAPGYDRGYHVSYAGYGPWEVNLGAVLGNAEAVNVLAARYGIQPWQPSSPYTQGMTVQNAGNFYYCVAPPAPTTALSSGAGPGPTGNYTVPQPDGGAGVQWINLTAPQFILNRSGRSYMPYDPSNTRVPAYSAVNFDAGGTGGSLALPNFPLNPFQTNPGFSNLGTQSFYDDGIADAAPTDTYDKQLNHPALFNPNDWPSGSSFRRTFPFSDLKRFTLRYAADREFLTQTDVHRTGVANASLIGNPALYSGNSYRRDTAHANRGLITTLTSSHDLPGLPPNFNTSVPAGVLSLPLNQLHPVSTAFTGAFAGGSGADFNGPTDFRNPKVVLGPIDLNRPLADYRLDTTQPLSDTNVGANNALVATFERNKLAKEIFARLIVSTGAAATVFTQTTPGPMMGTAYQPGDIRIDVLPNTPEYNALRYLAQLAANMVDLRDSDDVSTPFMWHIATPPNPVPPNTLFNIPDAATLQALIVQAGAQAPSGVVFGVEKPRLVINEAYGEITNEPGEVFNAGMPAQQPGRVRFFVELLNPTNTAYAAAGNAPLGNGEVTVRTAGMAPFSPYQLQITQVTPANANDLTTPGNVLGVLNPAANTSLTFDFSTAAGVLRTVQPVGPGTAPGPYAPNNGSPGFLLVGPPAYPNVHMSGGMAVEWSPVTGVNPFLAGNAFANGTTSAMEYQLANAPSTMNLENVNAMQPFRQHAVLLRRLANPYLPPANDNPYITVDVMKNVPAYDAVIRGGGAMDMADRMAKAGGGVTTDPGFEAINNRFSVGKVQPYAGHSVQQTAMPAAGNVREIGSFATDGSFVIRQNPNPVNASDPQHTFFRMNGRNAVAPALQTYTVPPAPLAFIGGETLMAPFDWFVHFDRPIVNQLELLSLQAVKPHEVTDYTIRNFGGVLNRTQGLTPWLGVNAMSGLPGYDLVNNRTNNGLFRALETLRVKPWMYGAAFGGKVRGKINLNTIQDYRVWQALIDLGASNGFTAADLSLAFSGQPAMGMTPPIPGFITNLPGQPANGSRTVNSKNAQAANLTTYMVPVPGPTYDDVPNPAGPNFNTNPPYDRPIRSLGAPEFVVDGSNSVLAARGGSGLQDTIFRVNPNTGAPLLSVSSQSHPYLQAEMVRKMHNNATTTSNSFAITITIVFHEVRMNGVSMEQINDGAGNRFVIGKEVYKDVPGDLRQQFFSVVDRSNIAMQLTPPGQIQPTPLFASLGQVPATGYGAAAGQTVAMVLANPGENTSGNLMPINPMTEMNPPTGSWNVYLANAVAAGSRPYTSAPGAYTVTVYADGRPVTIGAGSIITLGTGLTKETLYVNYVNADGSLNIGDPNNMMAPRPAPARMHSVGELASNCSLGNPGPIGTANNPGPFDPNAANSLYRGIVPYFQRVR